jgi:chitin synthase
VLLDVGTTPGEKGLANLIKGFQGGPDIGGVSGFMSVDANFQSEEGEKEGEKATHCLAELLSIEKAQEYEYIISHFLDKNQESALGFLHVLPGAWSAYRY